uniref:NR LBD domain-containing protein n=1 Tax=Rhabditophanes sp. KR3021 TaxID=114890 RepID=A0AC35TGG9_9BILA
MLDSILINLDYIKTFPFYSTLLLDDQKEILRFTGASLSIADNSYYSYVNGYSTITCPDGFQPIRMRHPEQPTKMDIIVSTNLVEMFQRLKPSPEEYCLLKILIFLNLNESKLSPETVLIINCERQKYSSTLLSYLQLQKGPTSGAVRFTEILNAVGTIFQYGDKLKDFQRIELIAARHRAEPAKCTPLPMLKYVMDL